VYTGWLDCVEFRTVKPAGRGRYGASDGQGPVMDKARPLMDRAGPMMVCSTAGRGRDGASDGRGGAGDVPLWNDEDIRTLCVMLLPYSGVSQSSSAV